MMLVAVKPFFDDRSPGNMDFARRIGNKMTDDLKPVNENGPHRVATDEVCLHVIGRCFRTSRERAQAFLRNVETSTFRGRPELAPLLHSEGVDLLFVTSRTPMSMHDIRDHSLDPQHRHAQPSEDRIRQARLSPALTYTVATDRPAARA
jgi:hypothetical protein